MKTRAMTLLELVIVIAIILLLTALLLPVILRSKRSAQAAVCTSNLRQAAMAWQMYTDTYDGVPPRSFKRWATDPNVIKVLRCPLDTFDPGANFDASRALKEKISYFDPFGIPEYQTAMEAADPDHGILACVLHGEPASEPVSDPLVDMKGLVLRARKDGSVQRVFVGHMCVGDSTRGVASTRSNWMLFSDVWPCPEPWCPPNAYKCP